MSENPQQGETSETPPSLFFWRQNDDPGNFGDALSLVFRDRLFGPRCKLATGEMHLIGSVITENRISAVLRSAQKRGNDHWRPVFWGCGKKTGDPLPPDLHAAAIFLGVRGVASRDVLGLPRDTPLGDTALLLPRIYTPKNHAATTGKVLWVPHFHYEDPGAADLDGCPDHVVMRPSIPNTTAACESFIDAIASSRFVMANAMHAAVVALAYGVPFAFWPGSEINCPFKWGDLTSGLGFSLPFCRTFAEGTAAYNSARPDRYMAAMDLDPLLAVAPYELRL